MEHIPVKYLAGRQLVRKILEAPSHIQMSLDRTEDEMLLFELYVPGEGRALLL